MPYPTWAPKKKSEPTGPQLTALDMVNPFDSPLRQFVCSQLATLLPNSVKVIYSHRKDTSMAFTEWTGYTQAGLETAWVKNGFRKATDDERKKTGRVWIRETGFAVTTSCEALVNKMVQKIKQVGYKNARPLNDHGILGSFNLAGCKANGKEPATTVGWHWYRDKSADSKPQAGDFFQVGTEVKPGQWSFAHVGIITDFWDFDEKKIPTWITVEAGQGGPGAGYDAIMRKGPRPVDPVDPKNKHKQLMGWLNIEEYFGGWDQRNGA
jgi:hypothetical protein